MEMVGNWISSGIGWVGRSIGEGFTWLINKGAEGILGMIGSACRFITNECFDTFLVFALIGAMVYICGCSKAGMKMIRLSIIVFIIMGVMGVIL